MISHQLRRTICYILEEKLDYPSNLEESVRKKEVKEAISQIGTLQRWFKAHLRKNM
jgi:ABC-type antimicrobial peptide transport system ATPase subunit